MKLLSYLLLLLALANCRTVYIWDQGTPRSGSELTTESEKKAEYEKFAVTGITPTRWDNNGHVGVKSQTRENQSTYFTLRSFRANFEQVSPTANATIDRIFDSNKYFWLAFAICAGSGTLSDNSNKGLSAIGDLFYFGSLGALVGISYWQFDLGSEATSQYNRDLRDYIFTSAKPDTTAKSKPALGFKLALDL